MIGDAAWLSALLSSPVDDPRDYLLAFYPELERAIPPVDHDDPSATPMIARINHGVWIAACDCGAGGVPAPGCVVWLALPRGWCVRCGNAAAGGRWRPIALPSAEERTQIEAIVLCRPALSDRNWEPGETVAEILRQNAEHGDPVPERG